MHPQNVRYDLVCRVLLGSNVTTSDGRNRVSDGGMVFVADTRNSLAALQDGKNQTACSLFRDRLRKS